jgi:hypothetical protein
VVTSPGLEGSRRALQRAFDVVGQHGVASCFDQLAAVDGDIDQGAVHSGGEHLLAGYVKWNVNGLEGVSENLG